uniref:Uncharacterized protein n=1 Tax=Globodera rostochiensis TaxID=31243 RepID=A0A914IAC4_GLORO
MSPRAQQSLGGGGFPGRVDLSAGELTLFRFSRRQKKAFTSQQKLKFGGLAHQTLRAIDVQTHLNNQLT